MAAHLGRLKEHKGSIFLIAWSSDGSKFMSVSDDRSACIWMLSCQSKNFVNQADKQHDVEIIPILTHFGHSARIWDCYVSDSVVMITGEDCTSIWDMDGKLIKMFKEHIESDYSAASSQQKRGGYSCPLALGDGRGNVTIVRLTSDNLELQIDLSFTWSAEKDRQLLGLYWCKSLECSHIFTADPRGMLKLWNIWNALFSNTHSITTSQEVPLVVMFESSFGAQIMCLDASLQEEILIAGDKKGNITVFPFPKILAAHDSSGTQQMMPLCDHFKGAHGISSVTSVHIITSTSDHIEIHATGGDGCICFFRYGRNVQKIELVGMKQIKELSTIQSIYTNHATENQLLGTFAIGFTSADFIIWDLENDTKMVQISCGGWRRPYSYYLGSWGSP